MLARRAASFAVACLVALATVAGFARPVAAANDYTDTASTVYTLDPAHGVINVTVDVTMTNRKPDTVMSNPCTKWAYAPYLGWYTYPSTCQQTTQYYFSSTSVWVEQEATNLRATSGATRLKASIGKPDPYFREVRISFPNLYYRQTRKVHVTYTLPGGQPRSSNPTRAMRAYANFCAIAQGYDSGTVSVHLPAGFVVTTTGSTMTSSTSGSDQILSSGNVSDPGTWWACVEGTNEAGYQVSEVTAPGDQTVMLESWPEDAAWTAALDNDLRTELPSLVTLIGREMDGSAPLVIKETVTGDEYAGFYERDTNTITVDEHYDQPALVGHELAHVWFNDRLFEATWLSEGYAEWAGRAVDTPSDPCTAPTRPSGTFPAIGAWEYLTPKSSDAERKAVAYEYDAACYVITAISDAAGPARMTTAIQAMLSGRDPYGAPDPGTGSTTSGETTATAAGPHVLTWRQWLDAVDELALQPAGAPPMLASELLLTYGATSDRATLEARAAARTAYHDLSAQVAGWTVPEAVRGPLRTWAFGAAQDAIAAALPAWTLTGQTDATLLGVDARHGPAAAAWAAATTTADLQAATALAQQQLDAAKEVAATEQLVESPRDLVEQIGLLGATVPDLQPAVDAVRTADVTGADQLVGSVRTLIEGARDVGQSRIAVAAGVVTAAGLLLLVLALRRRRRVAVARSAAAVSGEAGFIGPSLTLLDGGSTTVAAAAQDAAGADRGWSPVEPWTEANDREVEPTVVDARPVGGADAAAGGEAPSEAPPD